MSPIKKIRRKNNDKISQIRNHERKTPTMYVPKVANIWVFGKFNLNDLVNKLKKLKFQKKFFLFVNIICQANFFT